MCAFVWESDYTSWYTCCLHITVFLELWGKCCEKYVICLFIIYEFVIHLQFRLMTFLKLNITSNNMVINYFT